MTPTEAAPFLQQAAGGKDKIQASGVTGVNTRLVAAKAVTHRLTLPKAALAMPAPALHENGLSK